MGLRSKQTNIYINIVSSSSILGHLNGYKQVVPKMFTSPNRPFSGPYNYSSCFLSWQFLLSSNLCPRFSPLLSCCSLIHSSLLSKILLFITGPNLNGRITWNPTPPKNPPLSPQYGDPHTPLKEGPRTAKGGAPPIFLQQTQVLPILQLRWKVLSTPKLQRGVPPTPRPVQGAHLSPPQPPSNLHIHQLTQGINHNV